MTCEKTEKEWYEVHFHLEMTGKKKVRASSFAEAAETVRCMRATQLGRGYNDLHLDVTRTVFLDKTPRGEDVMPKKTKKESVEDMLDKLHAQTLIVLADYQTMKAYAYAANDAEQRIPLDAAYFARGGEGLRMEVAQRIDDNARLIFGVPRRRRLG